jgi:HSP20 family protein
MLYGSAITPFFSLRRDIDRLFEDALGGSNRMAWIPAVDVREDASELLLEFELPGLRPEDVQVTAENGVLTVHGEKRTERKEGEESRWHLVERSYGTFTRSFQLPKGLDEGQIEANFEHGVLRVRIPKAALPQPRRIQIRGAQSSNQVSEGTGAKKVASSSANDGGERVNHGNRNRGAEERELATSGSR